MKQIPLTKGKVALVDDVDYDYLIGFGGWYAGRCYPQIVEKPANKCHLMHAVLWTRWGHTIPEGLMLDHEDGNGFNNQKHNLRLATRTQNVVNSRVRSHNQSGYKGVHLDKRSGNYQAMIRINNRLEHIGMFVDSMEAACAFNLCAKAIYHEFARLNDVPFSTVALEAIERNDKLLAAIAAYPGATEI